MPPPDHQPHNFRPSGGGQVHLRRPHSLSGSQAEVYKRAVKSEAEKLQQIARLLDLRSNAQPSSSPPAYNLLALRHQMAHLYSRESLASASTEPQNVAPSNTGTEETDSSVETSFARRRGKVGTV